jgi:DNA topoisomerase VI subunit B
MYIDTRNMSHGDKVKKKRQLNMQKMSYDSDLKKVIRKQEELRDELRRFERDQARLQIYIEENEEKMKTAKEKETFLNEEIRQIKKQLIELG